MILYAVDVLSEPPSDGKRRSKGSSSKRDLAAQNGSEKNKIDGSEVGERRGHFEEILLAKGQSQDRSKRDITLHANFGFTIRQGVRPLDHR